MKNILLDAIIPCSDAFCWKEIELCTIEGHLYTNCKV